MQRLRSRAPLGLCLAAVILLSASSPLAAAGCKKVNGKFSLLPVTGPDCNSPVGICAAGTYKGDLAGESFFTASAVIPTADTPSTGVVIVTGDNVFTLSGGTLTTKDAIVLKTTGAGEFAEVDTLVGGTGAWAGATGTLTGEGTFTAAGGGEGTYSGEICAS